MQRERERVRLNLLKLIAATANADERVSAEEKMLFTFFLESAALPNAKKKAARAYLEDGVSLQDIEWEALTHWVLKKYFLEIALLTIRADRLIQDAELTFLEKIIARLSLEPTELGHSMVAIEEFVGDHKPRVHYLQTKQLYKLASERYINSMQLAVRKNRRRITQEISESRNWCTFWVNGGGRTLPPKNGKGTQTASGYIKSHSNVHYIYVARWLYYLAVTLAHFAQKTPLSQFFYRRLNRK